MSWAKDEWKQDLSPKALQKITDMEKEHENLQKLRQQQDLKMDGYVTALERGKLDLEEERSSNAALQKEVQELKSKITNLEAKQERYINEIKSKEKTVEYGEDLLDKARQKLKEWDAKTVEMQKSLDQKTAEAEKYAERSEKLTVEIGKLKQEKAYIIKESENYKERVDALTKEIQSLHQTISQNEQKALEMAQESEKDNDESCPSEPVVLGNRADAFVDILKKENTALLKELEQLRLQREQMKNIVEEKTNEVERNSAKLADVRVELQKAKKDFKDSKCKIAKLEGAVGTREREIRSFREKIVKFKTNEERMNDEMKTLKDQLKAQTDSLGAKEDSRCKEIKDIGEGGAGVSLEEESKIGSAENKPHQLSHENESLHEQIRWLREANSVLRNNLKDKDERLKSFYDQQQQQHQKEEVRLEKVEGLLLENADLKERINELEKVAKVSAHVCARCKHDIMVNDKLEPSNSEDKKNIPDSQDDQDDQDDNDLKMMTETVAKTLQHEDHKDGNATMSERKDADNEPEKHLQMNDQSMQIDEDINEMKATEKGSCLEHQSTCLNEDKDESSDVVSCTTMELDSNLQNKILQVLVSLITVQIEQEMVQRGVGKCYTTVKMMKQNITSPASETRDQDAMSKLLPTIHCLTTQMKAVEETGQRCVASIKCQLESIASFLETVRKEKNTKVQDERKVAEDVQTTDKKVTRSPERELSWDNFESEHAFQLFKSSVEPLIKKIEEEDEILLTVRSEIPEATTKSRIEMKRGTYKDEGRSKSREKLEINPGSKKDDKLETVDVLQMDDLLDVLRDLIDENNDILAERMELLLQHFEHNLINIITEIQRKENKLSIEQCEKKFSSAVEQRDSEGETHPSLKDESRVLGELELMKKRISGIQKLVKHLMSSTEATIEEKEQANSHIDLLTNQIRNISSHHEMLYTELQNKLRTATQRELSLQRNISDLQTEKQQANSHIDLLTNQMRNVSSHHEMRYTELQNNLRTASERELSLQRQISELQTEKENINCNYKENYENLKKKEADLASLSQEIKNIQAKSRENEAKLKKKIEVLQGEKTCVWQDYMEVSKEAQQRKEEVESMVAKMKKTEVSLVSLFNTIGNIDDFLQRAKEMNLFQ